MISLLRYILLCFLFSACQRGEVTKYTYYLNHNDTVKYVGKEQCRMCHAEIYDSYLETGMGKSFHYATKQNSAISDTVPIVYDSDKNLYYKPFWKSDSLYLLEYRLSNLDTIHKLIKKVDYKIGSGHHTNSHIFEINGYLHQIPYTYYTQDSIADLPPGFENGMNSRFSRKIGMECMTCHNAHPTHDITSDNKYEHVLNGIDCERCHGPGELHVKRKLAGELVDTSKYIDYTIVNPSRLDKKLQFDVCQRCHLQGTTVLNDSSDFTDYKPGMHLHEYMETYIPKYDNDNSFIMASHVDRLMQSSCYQNSDITCISCHNPHKSVQTLDNNYFDNKCKQCHQECDETEVNNCVSCHMPKSNTLDIMHVSITDHKIGIHSKKKNEKGSFLGLIPINNKNASSLSRAKAYLKHYEGFSNDSYLLDSAFYFLQKSDDHFVSFVKYYYLKNDHGGLINYVLNHKLDTINYKTSDLAMAFSRSGDIFSKNDLLDLAEKYLMLSVRLMPKVIDYKIKLAVFWVNSKKYNDAYILLNNALKLNPTVKEIHLNIGYIDIVNKRYFMAENRLKQAVMLDPDYLLAYENLYLLSQLKNNKRDILYYFNKIIEIDPKHKLKEILN